MIQKVVFEAQRPQMLPCHEPEVYAKSSKAPINGDYFQGVGLGNLTAKEWNREACTEPQEPKVREFGKCITGPFPSYDGKNSTSFAQFTASDFNIKEGASIRSITINAFAGDQCQSEPRWSVNAVEDPKTGKWSVDCDYHDVAQSYIITVRTKVGPVMHLWKDGGCSGEEARIDLEPLQCFDYPPGHWRTIKVTNLADISESTRWILHAFEGLQCGHTAEYIPIDLNTTDTPCYTANYNDDRGLLWPRGKPQP